MQLLHNCPRPHHFLVAGNWLFWGKQYLEGIKEMQMNVSNSLWVKASVLFQKQTWHLYCILCEFYTAI